MGTQPVDPVADACGGLQIHLTTAGQAQRAAEIKARLGQARLLAAVEPQDLVLVVGHQHPVGIEGDGAGGVAGAGVEAAAGGQRRGCRSAVIKCVAGTAAAVSHRHGDRGQAGAAWGDLQLAVGAAATEHQIGVADHRLIAAANAQLQIV